MKTKIFRTLTALGLTLAIAATSVSTSFVNADESETVSEVSKVEQFSSERLSTNYTNVSKGYTAGAYTGADVIHEMEESVTNGSVLTLSLDVPETALYNVGFDYMSIDDSILPIEFSFMVDGQFPFYESRSLKFETTWVAESGTDLDRYGNEIVTLPTKASRWEHKCLADASYRYSDPLMVQLEKGSHEITIEVQEGTFLLGNISLEAPKSIPAYTGSEVATGDVLIKIEAEDFYERNDSSIHATGEYDSSVAPLSSSETVLNIIDDASFSDAGQMVSYLFEVDTPGYYYIGMNYRQSEKSDFPVFVDYRIDGEIPNEAFKNYQIPYTTRYKTMTLTDADKNKLSVYLEPGEHVISMTLSIDPIRYALEAVDEIMSGISDLSLEVTKVAGTNKDKYRDLKITRYIPDVQDRLYGWVNELTEIANEATVYAGVSKAKDVAAFSYLLIAAKQLESLAEEPNELVYRVDELSTSVNSINTQIANFVDLIGKNNLAIDRIYIYQDGAKLPKRLNIFKSLALSVERFFNSFFGQSYSASNTNKEHVQVWVNRPRQYVEIMQKMIDDEFTPETGIEVDLAIMTDANKLILSNASGDTPDIATGINYSIPFELGIRGALVDLTQFDDYKEVFGRYSDGILVSSVIDEKLISLPETMNFYVMFYRSDILEKLGLEAPETMDDLIAMLPDLQMRGLNVYYPTAVMLAMRNFHGTTPLIFQNGGALYGETAQDLLLDSEATVAGFTELTELFTLYNMPVDIPNFYQHFRNGDLAIGIADFNSYNLILNAAPEIANSWEIGLVPGVYNEETGEVLRYMSGGAESTVMFKSDFEREKRAWEFMKWWSSADVQAEFGQMLQIMYGDEYIWPTANLEAFNRLPYPTKDKATIMEQASNILEAPRLLGSYMTEREVSNAFNAIVVDGEDVRSEIDDAVKIINRETNRKLEEFGYIDSDGNVLKEYYVPSVDKVREILGTK